MVQPFFLPVYFFKKTSLFQNIEKQTQAFYNLWYRTPRHGLPLNRLYSPNEQQHRENILRKFIRQIEAEDIRNRIAEKQVQKRIFEHVRSFFHSGLDYEASCLNLILSPECIKSTEDFIRKAKQFDPGLSSGDLFQASRNVWIMNGLQIMLGLPVCLTDSIFAYSLLYPYTDNYVDDIQVSASQKIQFNNRFARRLAGLPVKAKNRHEEIIYSLVEMIEGEFDRQHFPRVFESLLAIHQAQTKSMVLLESEQLSEEFILRISLEKGGTSVVADGYLVAGDLTEAQENFMYGYGAYLQLLDDLQDVNQDAQAGQQSVFTLESEHTCLDAITIQTFNFGEHILSGEYGFKGVETARYTRLMHGSIQLMLLEAAGFAADRFTAPFIQTLEYHSPFRFDQLKTMKAEHAPYYASLFGKLL